MADYTLEGAKWGSSTLGTQGGTITWAFDGSVPASFENDFKTAFDAWSNAGNIQFEEISSGSSANIVVSYGYIDGSGNVAGEASYGYWDGKILDATIKIDSGNGWYDSGDHVFAGDNFPLELIATHEIGHAIGLGHYEGARAVMNSTVTYLDGLQQSDIDGVQALYGVVCYATGTLIRTVRGDDLVENLKVGDHLVTSSGRHRSIRWIGHRTIRTGEHRRPAEVMPVRIAAGALGENRPARDLRVSPGHAIAIDVLGEVLIPALALVNGSTIVQEAVDSVAYWHVELDSHDILIAEGQPAESYLDMGNRDFFADGPGIDLGGPPDAAAAGTHADFCRPFHVDGALVDVVRARSRARAETLGWILVTPGTWHDVHLEVDGAIVRAKTRGLTASFLVPADARDVWLICPTSVPSHVGDSADTRALGLCLSGLSLYDGLGAARSIALDDPALCVGFYAASADHRWTAGRARLPANLFEGMEGDVFLRIDLLGPVLPRWVAPTADGAAEDPSEAPPLRLVAA